MPTLLHIESIDQNGQTGHITVHAYIVETDEKGHEEKGSPETFGIDPLSLQNLFGTDDKCVDKWLAKVKEKMLERHQVRKGMHADLKRLEGKRM